MEELTKEEGRGYCAEREEQPRGWVSCGWFSGVSVGGSSALSPFGVKYLLAKWKSVHYARLRYQARKRAQGAPVKGPQAPGRAGTGPSVCSQSPGWASSLNGLTKTFLFSPDIRPHPQDFSVLLGQDLTQ